MFTILGTKYMSVRSNEANTTLYNNFYINITGMAIAIFTLVKYGENKIVSKLKDISIINNLSKYTFGIYLSHFLPISILKYFGITSISFNPLFSIPIISILVFITSLIITYIISKVPILNKYII